jgi:replicative DNA helicase
MFIYRPEYYGIMEDDNGTTAGMADIILAKHRSGGVGEVRLRFIGKYARFENKEFTTNEQLSNSMPQNASFDNGSGTTIIVDSKINRENNDFNQGLLPDSEVPF